MSEEEKLQLENECLLKYSKAQMIQKYIDELEENCTLSDLWYKSQEENKRLNNIINELDNMFYETFRISQNGYYSISEWELKEFTDKIKELKGGDKE